MYVPKTTGPPTNPNKKQKNTVFDKATENNYRYDFLIFTPAF